MLRKVNTWASLKEQPLIGVSRMSRRRLGKERKERIPMSKGIHMPRPCGWRGCGDMGTFRDWILWLEHEEQGGTWCAMGASNTMMGWTGLPLGPGTGGSRKPH